jgi:DNA topoisomerase II
MASKKITSESTLQHLHRKPDNYIGGNSITEQTIFVYENDQIVHKLVDDWNEPLIHIFKEAIDNASDNVANKWSTPQSYIDIKVDRNSVQVTNDGMPIHIVEEEIELPNEITKKIEVHKLWRSQALFNYFRTGTNAKNGEKDDSIGTNGIGSKSIWAVSKYAKLHHGDPDNQKQLVMEYHDKMSKISEPKITSYNSKKSFTTFYYEPDFEWFGFTKFSKNHIGIMHAMAVCLAYTSKIKVVFNDKEIKVPTLKKLGEMFFGQRNSIEFTNTNGDNVLVMEQSLEEMETYGIRQLAFVNGSFTRDGGIHVDRNATKIGKCLAEAYGSGLKGVDASKFFIYIANYKISTPDCEWTGQTKAGLKGLKNKKQLKHVDVEKKDFNKCKKWELWNQIATFLEGKTNRVANKAVGNKEYIGALGKNGIDAYYAGSKNKKQRDKCELYLTEGLSAKGLIDSGSKYRAGSDYVGVLALRGKLCNVLTLNREKQTDKQFINLIRQMIGLKMGCKYLSNEECATLRYPTVIIATDKDHDGSHILLLLMVFFQSEHPGLLENGIINFLETPVIKTIVGKETHRFFLREDFDEWLKEQTESRRTQAVKNCKFIKGLGGNNNTDDAKFIFGDEFFTGQVLFKKEKDKDMLQTFFQGGKDNVKQKKEYMMATFYNKEEWVHKPRKGTMTFSQFIESRYILAIDEQIHRAIPYVYDGLIESKKEIVYTALKHLKSLSKTVQFAMSVAVESAYSHGEGNLPPTVTKMAQTIIGANNIAVFKGDGIFGSRFVGPDEMHAAAAPRYTFVELQSLMYTIFREDDNPILEYEEQDGKITSPKYFLPIIPFFAVNGILHAPANTFSTSFPSYNPDDLVKWVKWWISENFKDTPKSESVQLVPWYRGFRGTFEKSPNGWISKGILIKKDDKTYIVDEICVDKWGVDLQEILEALASDKKIEKPRIFNLDTNTIKAEIKMKHDFDIAKCLESILEKKMPMTNVTLCHDYSPVTLNNIEDHLDEYARRRYKGYQDRRKYKIPQLERQLKLITDKVNFIKLVLDGTINFRKIKDKEELVEKLLQLEFIGEEWDHITSMTMLSCTQKGIDNLEKERQRVEKIYLYYQNNKPWQIWLDELDEFQKDYIKYLKDNPIDTVAENWKPPGK